MNSTDHRIDIDGVSVSPAHFIGGKRVASKRTFEVRTPLDWSWKLADIARGDAGTAAQAMAAAVDGFKAWSALTVDKRAQALHNLADLIDATRGHRGRRMPRHGDAAAQSASAINSARARNFRAYADLMREYQPRRWQSNNTDNRVLRAPAGPAVIITPWNAPFMLATWKCAPPWPRATRWC